MLEHSPWARQGDPVVVAVSGGLDSMSLLHLLRFGVPIDPDLIHVAHFDHRMRSGSARDAQWLAGVCTAWGVPFHGGEAEAPLSTEAQAREARYGFLIEAKEQVGATAVLTAHTADDQAETVLFRAARGSGPDGLAAVQPRREDGVERPLVGVWRTDLEAYARSVGLPVRHDPTNIETRWTRNRIRSEILPVLEQLVPGAKASLARLAGLSLDQRRALRGLSAPALDGVLLPRTDPSERGLVLDLTTVETWSDAVIAQVVREAGRRLGVGLGAGAVGRTIDLVRRGRDGASVDLAGGHMATRSSGALRLGVGSSPEPAGTQPSLRIERGDRPGKGRWQVGGRLLEVTWGPCAFPTEGTSPDPELSSPGGETPDPALEPPPLKDADLAVVLSATGLRFPLELRTRKPGDRMPVDGRERRLKKIMMELGVPSFERDTTPVLADASGSVLWIPGRTAPEWAPEGNRLKSAAEGAIPGRPCFCVALGRPEGEVRS